MRQLLILLVACIVGGWEAASADEALPTVSSDVLVAQYLTSPPLVCAPPMERIFHRRTGRGDQDRQWHQLADPLRHPQRRQLQRSRHPRPVLRSRLRHQHYLYVYYTAPSATTPDGPTVNRVSRFDASTSSAGPEMLLFTSDTLTTTFCNGGGIGFGGDGKLYICSGNGEVDANFAVALHHPRQGAAHQCRWHHPRRQPLMSPATPDQPRHLVQWLSQQLLLRHRSITGTIFCNDVRGTNNLNAVVQAQAGAVFGYPVDLSSQPASPYGAPLLAIPTAPRCQPGQVPDRGRLLPPGSDAPAYEAVHCLRLHAPA